MIVKPRDAASLIIVRDGARGREILMGRRHSRARFVPGCYVFPGGAVDPADYLALPASRLKNAIASKLGVADSARRAQALAMAAIRETFEETGLMVGERTSALGPADPAWRDFVNAGLVPALANLTYVGRAITPTGSRMRFHARFFAVDGRHAAGELRGDGELDDLRWVSASDISDLPLVDVTEFMLGEVLFPKQYRGSAKPLHGYRNGVPWIRFV